MVIFHSYARLPEGTSPFWNPDHRTSTSFWEKMRGLKIIIHLLVDATPMLVDHSVGTSRSWGYPYTHKRTHTHIIICATVETQFMWGGHGIAS